VDGILKANVDFPGLTIRYTTEGSETNVKSKVYEKPVQVGATVRVRGYNRVGRGGRICTVQNPSTQTRL
jgi:hexosaminidase